MSLRKWRSDHGRGSQGAEHWLAVLPPTAGTEAGIGGPCKVSHSSPCCWGAPDFLVSEPRSRLRLVGFLPGSLLLEAVSDLDPLLDFYVCVVVF